MMKKLFLLLAICIATTTVYAEILNIQTSGVTKLINNTQANQCSGEYSFSIDTNRNLLFINCQNQGKQNCFSQIGTYKIEHAQTIRDNSVGTAYVFLISKDNKDYVLTMTSKMFSFSQSGQTASLCWHFHIIK